MSTMSKKAPPPPLEDHSHEPEDVRILLRVPDKTLVAAIDEYARRLRRSRNMALILLLEEAMRRENLWPAADAD